MVATTLTGVTVATQSAASASGFGTDAFMNIDGSARYTPSPVPPLNQFGWANGPAPAVTPATPAGFDLTTCAGGGVHAPGLNGLYDCGKPNPGPSTVPLPPTYIGPAVGTNGVLAQQFLTSPTPSDTVSCTSTTTATGAYILPGGTKFNSGLSQLGYSVGSVPPKDAAADAFAVSRVNTSGDVEVFFGAQRTDNNGDSHVDFQFLQDGVSTVDSTPGNSCSGGFSGSREQGDILVDTNYVNGGGVTAPHVYKWICNAANSPTGTKCDTTGDWVLQSPVPPVDVALEESNSSTISCGGWVCEGTSATQIQPQEFVEGAINLGKIGFTASCASTLFVETSSSQSGSSQLKTVVKPTAFADCVPTNTATSASPKSQLIGGSFTDSVSVTATNSSLGTPKGTVTFYYCSNTTNLCVPPPNGTATKVPGQDPAGVTLDNAGSATSPAFTPLTPGNYCFAAVFTPAPGTFFAPSTDSHPAGTPNPECFTAIPMQPKIGLVKSADVSSFAAPGTVVHYSYVITNTGNVTLNPVTLADPMTGLQNLSCPATSLAPAGTETCTASYTTTQADVDAGSINNTGTATGTPPSGPNVTAQSSVSIPATQTPAINLVKSADQSSFSAPGTVVHYSYLVTNTGNVTLHSVTVTDPMANLSAISCPATTLAPTATETCTASYTTTQADVDHGSINNTGTATGTAPSGQKVTSQSSVTIPATQTPAITLKKSANVKSFAAPGTTVGYSYLITNTGNVTLNPVTLADPMSGLQNLSCPATSLAPAGTETCTASYTTTQADVDAGSISNTGTATGTAPSGQKVTAQDTVTIPAIQTPGISLKKTADITTFSAAGTVVHYSYLVKNTGNVTLNPVSLADPMSGLQNLSCPATSLAPAGTETCTASYTTTQADVDAGSINNTGTATGTAPSGQKVTAQSSVSIPSSQSPSIELLKTADAASFSAPGTVVHYSYLITNNGNVTLNPVTLSDPMAGLANLSCPATSLAVGASETCTASYTTTQADVDAGSINNTGTATGTPPSGPNVTAKSSVSIPAAQTPAITLVKTADHSSFSAPGTVVKYSYLITNTGNVTLNPVTLADPMTGLQKLSCPATSLAVGASETCTASYTTTQADVDAGSISNTGTATGTPPTGKNVTAQSSVTVPASQTPDISLVKSADHSSFSAPGTVVKYSYLITNTGNVTLNPVTLTDPMTGLQNLSCPATSLAPAGSETCTASYTTTQADVDAGSISNTGTATGTAPSGQKVTAQSSVTVPASQTPAITLVKSADHSSFSAPGTVVKYSYLITNTGNVTLNPVTLADPMTGLQNLSCPATSLAPAGSETCTASYTTTQADVDAGSISNTGTATGKPPAGQNVTAQSSVTIPATQSPAIHIVKSADKTTYSAPGILVTYSYDVTNTGNVTLNPVVVTDPMTGLSALSCPATKLAPAASETCTATYTTTQANVDADSLNNTGTATGTPPSGIPVSGTSSVSIPATQNPAISLLKTASITSYSAAGTAVTYSYKVTNTGNVTLTSVSVTDPMTGLSALACPASTLAPAASETCTATYTTTAADVSAGSINNTGTATGNPPSGPPVTATSSVSVPGFDLVVTKTSAPASTVNVVPGQSVTYTLTFSNANGQASGAVNYTDDLTGVLDDATVTSAPAVASGAPLAVSGITNGTFTVTGTLPAQGSTTITYTVKVDNPDTGNHVLTNFVVPTGTPTPNTCAATNPDCTTNPVADIALVKSASATSVTGTGVLVTYSYKVTNTGEAVLDPVVVTDPMSGLSALSCPKTSLTPGQSETCTATYTTTAADVTAGALRNTGTATGTPPAGTPVTATSSLIIPVAAKGVTPQVTTTTVPKPALAFTGLRATQLLMIAGLLIAWGMVIVGAGYSRRRPQTAGPRRRFRR